MYGFNQDCGFSISCRNRKGQIKLKSCLESWIHDERFDILDKCQINQLQIYNYLSISYLTVDKEKKAKVFYYVNYGSSIITSKKSSNNLSNENIHWCFQRNDISKIVHFGILIHILFWNIYFRFLRKKHKLIINNYLTE